MKIVLIGEENFLKLLGKFMETINLKVEKIYMDLYPENLSYKLLLSYYEVISSFLEKLSEEDNVICIVGIDISLLDFKNMPSVHTVYTRNHKLFEKYFYEILFSRLILSFPDVWWVFIKGRKGSLTDSYFDTNLHSININAQDLQKEIMEKLFIYSNTSPLFDLSGLYNYLVQNKLGKVNATTSPDFVFLLWEEEIDYIFYMFYALTEFESVKVFPLHLYRFLEEYIDKYKKDNSKFLCFIHDRFYYPVDLPEDENLEDLEKRLEKFHLKEPSPYRKHLLVSFSDIRDNEKNIISRSIKKPLNSIISFQNEIKEALGEAGKLLKEKDYITKFEKEQAHSSKGSVFQIVSTILRRAERRYENIKNAEDAFKVALMARYALEILEGKNLNVLYRAFSLKVRAESLGEVIFTGSDVNIDIDKKVERIKRFLDKVAENFNFGKDEKRKSSMKLLLLNELLNVYTEHNQLEEQLSLINYIREEAISRKLKAKKLGVFYPIISLILIKPLSSFYDTLKLASAFVVFSMFVYILFEYLKSSELFEKLNDSVYVRAFIESVYGIITANINGNLFGVIVSLLNFWFMVIVIGYFITYIIRR